MSTVMADIYRALGGPWEAAAEVEDALAGAVPDRTVQTPVACAGVVGDEDDWTDETPCGWEGVADVQVFDDTQEALWWCPSGHENSIRYGDVA